jgi:hypothetical protein
MDPMIEQPRSSPLDELDEDDVIEPRVWRRWLLGIVAGLLVILLVAGPVSNLLERAQPQIAENGLELCAFDYCVVQSAVRSAGYGPTMARLVATELDSAEAQVLADSLVTVIGQRAVTIEVVASLPESLAGRYGIDSRVIQVVEPIRAWVVVHEVSHTNAGGHGSAFIDTLLRLLGSLEQDG